MTRLRNGNVKFSHTNRKHFTVGDPMAFPIVKMGNKNPQNLLFPLHGVDRHLIQQCLGSPHAPPQTAVPTVEALSHTYTVKSPLVTMPRPKFAPKSTFPWIDRQIHHLSHPWTRPTYDAKQHPDLIRLLSTMYWIVRQTDKQTDRPTDRQIVHGKV